MKLKFYAPFLAFLAIVFAISAPVRAQEGEPIVIDEVIAQVNNDVVTLSMVRKASADALESFKQSGVDEKKAAEEVAKRQSEIILSLIDEQLLAQKSKDIGLDDGIEGEVNRELLRIAGEYKVKTLDELYELMRRSGVQPESVRRTLRLQYTRDLVLRQDLYQPLYFEPELPQVQAYFEKNRDKFKRPEAVELSEIFLELAGKPEAAVLDKAKQIVAEARQPKADFVALAVANSERPGPDGRPLAPQNKGKVGKFTVPDLNPEIAAAIKNVPAGGVAEPLKTAEGYVILRVDTRVVGSDASTFNEDQVRQAMLAEKADAARTKYLAKLRQEAYLKVADSYRPTVDPLLYKDAPAPGDAAVNDKPGKKGKDKKDKKKS